MTVNLNPPIFVITPRNGTLRSRDPDGDGVDESTGNVGTIALQQPANVSDTGGFATITVRRTGGSFGAVGVSYATADGTGLEDVDYTAVAGTLNWADGDSADKTFQIPIIDRTGETQGNKTVNITLSGVTGGAALGSSSAMLTITDSDAATGTIQYIGLSPSNPERFISQAAWTSTGLMHDPATGHPIQVSMFGYGHGGGENSSIVAYDYVDNGWVYIQQDRSGGYPGNVDDVVRQRNNHTAFYIDFDNQIWVGGGLSEVSGQPMNHGIMDISESNPSNPSDANWKYIWEEGGAFSSDFGVSASNGGSMIKGDPGHDIIKGVVPGSSKVMTAINGAPASSNVLRCLVRYGGGLYYGPSSFAAYSNEYMIWEKNYNGPEPWVYSEFFQGDDPLTDMPQIKAAQAAGSVCAGECYYVYCGLTIPDTTNPRGGEFWRMHIPTRTWVQLPTCPRNPIYGHLVYVTRTNQIVLLGSYETTGGALDYSDATNIIVVYDIATSQWTDYTSISPLRYINFPLCGYCPELDIVSYGVGFSGKDTDGVTALTNSQLAQLDLFRLVGTGKSVDDIEQVDPGPIFNPMSMDTKLVSTGAWNPNNDRWYMIGGDWLGKGGSFKREVWSTNPKTPGGDWIMESGYCPPTPTDPWYKGRTENLVIWHPTEQVFYVAGGIDQNTSSACGFPASETVSAYILKFDPNEPTLPWSIPTQDPRPTSGNLWKYGYFDYLRNELVLIDAGSSSATFYGFGVDTGTWRIVAQPQFGQIVTRGDQCRRGRKLYMAAEAFEGAAYNLYEFDIDTAQFTDLGLLPEDPHVGDDPQGLFAPQTLLTYWAKKDVLAWTHIYRQNAMWFYHFDTQQWTAKTLSAADTILGNSMFSVGPDGPIVFGGSRLGLWNDRYPYWVIHDLDI